VLAIVRCGDLDSAYSSDFFSNFKDQRNMRERKIQTDRQMDRERERFHVSSFFFFLSIFIPNCPKLGFAKISFNG
jgi:hypothetical protein